MRIILLILILITSGTLKAQTPPLNYTPMGTPAYYQPFNDSSLFQKKWSLHKYVGVSASYAFMNGASASIYSIPVGLQLNRQLNNNLVAYAGISAAPAYYNFNRSFIQSDINKTTTSSPWSSTNRYGLYSKFEAGLMYINDDRTFSISGSIGIQKSSYPAYPYYYQPNLPKQQPLNGSRQ